MERKAPEKAPQPVKKVESSAPAPVPAISLGAGGDSHATSMQGLLSYLYDLEKSEKDGRPARKKGNISPLRLTQQLPELVQAQSEFLGVLTRCMIPGCDVHTLSENKEIEDHFASAQSVPAGFERARALLNDSLDNVMCILVYNDHLELLYIDGTTERPE